MKPQVTWPVPEEKKPQLKISIMEDAEIAQGRYSHFFVTGFNKQFEHFTLDFYQDSTPFPESNQINRRLVARIFLTKLGLLELGKVLGDLNQMINKPKIQPPPELNKTNQ